jgi:hypothetical protein
LTASSVTPPSKLFLIAQYNNTKNPYLPGLDITPYLKSRQEMEINILFFKFYKKNMGGGTLVFNAVIPREEEGYIRYSASHYRYPPLTHINIFFAHTPFVIKTQMC